MRYLPWTGLRPWRVVAALVSVSAALPGGLGVARAADVRAAVAANAVPAVTHLAPAFEAATGHRLRITSGATGTFAAQIAAGAPFDVLLAADEQTPARLAAQGHAAGAPFTYAVGQLVLWSAEPGRVDAQGQVLRDGAFQHLALANPRTAPYGRAAMQALAALGLDAALAPRLVTGESVAQAWQFTATGQAELGFVALSQVLPVPGPAAPGSAPPRDAARGSMWRVPAHLHAPIRQDAVLLKPGADNPGAAAFVRYLQGDEARRVLRVFGYATP